MELISPTQRALVKLVQTALFQTCKVDLSEMDLNELCQEANVQAVLSLILPQLRPSLPADSPWIKTGNLAYATIVRVCFENTELHTLMNEKKIQYVVLKGAASLSYYPESALRSMGDVDFLVRQEDWNRAEASLNAIGFQHIEHNGSTCHLAFLRGPSVWEMHWEPNGIPDGPVGELIREYFSDIIEKARLYSVDDCTCMIPSTFHHGLVLILHTAKHLFTSGIGLRHLCDWAVFVNNLSEFEFVDLFENKLKAVGLWHFAQILTITATEYLGCRVCEWAGTADDTLIQGIIEDVFLGGNFGIKDDQRSYQSKLIHEYGTQYVEENGSFKQFFLSMNRKSWEVMPLTKKCPALLPLGWFYAGARHMVRIVRGKRPKVHFNEMVDGANRRKSIYRHFHLFEPELNFHKVDQTQNRGRF